MFDYFFFENARIVGTKNKRETRTFTAFFFARIGGRYRWCNDVKIDILGCNPYNITVTTPSGKTLMSLTTDNYKSFLYDSGAKQRDSLLWCGEGYCKSARDKKCNKIREFEVEINKEINSEKHDK